MIDIDLDNPEMSDEQVLGEFSFCNVVSLTHLQQREPRASVGLPFTPFSSPISALNPLMDNSVTSFACAATHCKTTLSGVRRFQDKQDRSSTANINSQSEKYATTLVILMQCVFLIIQYNTLTMVNLITMKSQSENVKNTSVGVYSHIEIERFTLFDFLNPSNINL